MNNTNWIPKFLELKQRGDDEIIEIDREYESIEYEEEFER